MLAVPLPDRSATRRDFAEPSLPTWAEVEMYLTHCESTLRCNPTLEDTVFALTARMIEFCAQIPEPMPAAVRAAFTRIRVSTSSEDA